MGIVAVILVSAVMAVLVQPRVAWEQLRVRITGSVRKMNRFDHLVFTGLTFHFLLETMIPILVIYPRDHYLLVPVGLALLGILLIQSRLGSQSVTVWLPFVLSFLLFRISTVTVLQQAVGRVTYPAPIARTLSLMANDVRDWKVLSTDWGLNNGLPVFVEGGQTIDPQQLGPVDSLRASLTEMDINSVWLTPDLKETGTQWFSDWDAFVSNPVAFDYRPLHPGSQLLILSE